MGNRGSSRGFEDGRWRLGARVVAGVLGLAALAFWARCVGLVVTYRIATDPAVDPHGYGLIFGTIFAVPTGLLAAGLLPQTLRPLHRARVTAVAMATYVVATVLLFAAFLTA
ncbi:hypothetical protein [Nocardia aurea]|uniref:hypothetical protein n=1 Tax=Nocardia aurea TaxID=2144174 RepID=UPI003F4CE6EC